MIVIQGRGVSAGIVQGRLHCFHRVGAAAVKRAGADPTEECARLGFDELLLEDLSYPTRGNLYKMSLDNNTRGKTEALVQLLTELRAAVEPYGTKLSLLLTEELIMAGADETSGVDLAAMLPLVDGVYADVSSAASAQALLQAAVGEGNEAPPLVCLLAEPGERESWCIPAA